MEIINRKDRKANKGNTASASASETSKRRGRKPSIDTAPVPVPEAPKRGKKPASVAPAPAPKAPKAPSKYDLAKVEYDKYPVIKPKKGECSLVVYGRGDKGFSLMPEKPYFSGDVDSVTDKMLLDDVRVPKGLQICLKTPKGTYHFPEKTKEG